MERNFAASKLHSLPHNGRARVPFEAKPRVGRVCFDLDDGEVVHFHDRTVPPEEEILAAKLVLENREPWLRNEATIFGVKERLRFKNPFGDAADGIWDADFTAKTGRIARALLNKVRA